MGIGKYGLHTPSLRDTPLKRGLSREIHLLKRGLLQESPLWRGDLGCVGELPEWLFAGVELKFTAEGAEDAEKNFLNIIFALSAVSAFKDKADGRLLIAWIKRLRDENLDC